MEEGGEEGRGTIDRTRCLAFFSLFSSYYSERYFQLHSKIRRVYVMDGDYRI